MKLSSPRLVDVFRCALCLLGAWCLYAQVCVLLKVPFVTLARLSLLPMLVVVLLLVLAYRSSTAACPHADRSSRGGVLPVAVPTWYRVAAPFALVSVYLVSRSAWVFWGLTVAHLGIEAVLVRSGPCADRLDGARAGWRERIVLLALAAAAVLITAGALRPDADDAYFVNVAVSCLDHPHLAPLAFDGMHGGGLPPVEQTLHLAGVYEILVATLSGATRVPVRVLYYIVLPALWAALGVLAHWILLRRFLAARAALFGVFALVVILVAWGDGHRTFGNFAFVRLFQGKAVFLFVVLPALLDAALEYRFAPSRFAWLCLMLTGCAAAGLTANALILVPLALGSVFLAAPRLTRSSARRALAGLAACMPLVLLTVAMYIRLLPYRSSLGVDPARIGYAFVFGDQRAGLVLLVLLLLPFLVSRASLPHASWIAGYVWMAFVVFFCPATAASLGATLSNVFTWRLFWALPVPFLLGLGLGSLVGDKTESRRRCAALALLWLAAFAACGGYAVSPRMWAWKNMGRFKVDTEAYDVAGRIMTGGVVGGMTLVPEPVAVCLTGFRGVPPLVGVRQLYLAKLKGVVSIDELSVRSRLLAYVGGEADAMSVSECMAHVSQRQIATLAFPASHPHAGLLMEALALRGYTLSGETRTIMAVRR